MKFITKIYTMIAVLCASVVLSSSAMAQSTVLVVDQARVLRESDVGKHVQRQLQSIAKQMGTEIQSQVTPLEAERKSLAVEFQNITNETLKSRPDLQRKAKSFQDKMGKAQVEEAYKQRELEVTRQKALKKVSDKLATILETLVKERNADVLLDRSVAIYVGTSVDVTDVVLSRLNSQMRTVSVIRERLPRTAQAPTGAR